MPIIAFLLRPCFSSAPITGEFLQPDAEVRGNLPCNHHFRQQRGILDLDQLLQDAQGRRRRAIGHRVTDRFPSAVEKQAVAAIERFRVLSPGQPPKQRQAAALRAILARIVSITRAPASVCAMTSGVSPSSSVKASRSQRLAVSLSASVSSASV
jgi:hypothetical protein